MVLNMSTVVSRDVPYVGTTYKLVGGQQIGSILQRRDKSNDLGQAMVLDGLKKQGVGSITSTRTSKGDERRKVAVSSRQHIG